MWRQVRENPETGLIGEGVGFERTRRITGYLVGTLERFNDAKRAEEKDRVRHKLKIERKLEQLDDVKRGEEQDSVTHQSPSPEERSFLSR